MDLSEARFLASDRGARLLAAAREARERPLHRRADALRGLGSGEEVRAALRQDDLRVRARAKAPRADEMLISGEGLEQATPWPVAVERATRWPGPPSATLHDLTAGLGLDALAAASAGRTVAAYERDEARAMLLEHNARALGLSERLSVHVRDVMREPPAGDLAFLDPGRRPGGRRTRDPARFEPPADAWPSLLSRFRAAMVKVPPVEAPAAETSALGASLPFEVVSLQGSLRERRLFVGAFGALPPRRALSLPTGASVAGDGAPWPEPVALVPGLHLLDPDPAVTVAGLVGDLARRDGLRPVHARIAYLVAERPSPRSPGVWMLVDAVLPARSREVDRWLAARDVGRLTIRERGIADPVATWRRRFHPRGRRDGTIAILRDASDRWIAACSLDQRTGSGALPSAPPGPSGIAGATRRGDVEGSP